jgi:hypothetical protein
MIDRLQQAYGFFNATLFGGRLPRVVIKLARFDGVASFTPGQKGGPHVVALNSERLAGHSEQNILSALVHEMAHCWDELYGQPAPGGLHGEAWAGTMRTIGLQPSGSGARITQSVMPDGAFARACTKLQAIGWQLDDLGTTPPAYAQPGGKRHKLTPPRPSIPQPSHAAQLSSGFESLGLLVSGCFHGALALAVLWLAGGIVDPIFSRWSSTWRMASAWVKTLIHALFN